MSDYTDAIIYSIYRSICDRPNVLTPNSILCDLSTERKYLVYEDLGRMSIPGFISDRIKHGDMKMGSNGELSLTAAGQGLLHFLEQTTIDPDSFSPRDYGLEQERECA